MIKVLQTYTRTLGMPRFNWPILGDNQLCFSLIGISIREVSKIMNLGRELDLSLGGGNIFVISVIDDYSHSSYFGQWQNFHSVDTIPKQLLIGHEVTVCHILVAYESLQMVIIILRFLSHDICFPVFISGHIYRFKVLMLYFSQYNIVVVL